MNISSTVFYKKLRETIPGLSPSITPEILSQICNDESVQPFLKWYCENVSRENVLLEEQIRIKDHLQKTNRWLEGEELESALEEATRHRPELLRLATPEVLDPEALQQECEAEESAYKEDLDYFRTLEDAIEKLKIEEEKLDEELEQEEMLLEKDGIEVEEAFNSCSASLEQFNSCHRQFSNDVERLVEVYADAAENKGPPVVWTQMPLDLYSKQMEVYSNYMQAYVKKQFECENAEEKSEDLDYASFDESNSKRNGVLQKLWCCQKNLLTSKLGEILEEVREVGCAAMEEHAIEIYQNQDSKIPETAMQLRTEIAELTAKRNFLLEDVTSLRENHLESAVKQFAELEIIKVVVEDARARLERRKSRLSELERVRDLIRDGGHAHSDLLCMLMEWQQRRLAEVAEFVVDARHYLKTEYNLSSLRRESMERQIAEYQPPSTPSNERNVFNKIFISMMLGDCDEPNALAAALKKYNDLVNDNEKRKKTLLGSEIDEKMKSAQDLANHVTELYDQETTTGATVSFKPMPHALETRFGKVADLVKEMRGDVMEIRNKVMKMVKKNIDFEREKQILWQRFLVDPETMKRNYEEACAKVNQNEFPGCL